MPFLRPITWLSVTHQFILHAEHISYSIAMPLLTLSCLFFQIFRGLAPQWHTHALLTTVPPFSAMTFCMQVPPLPRTSLSLFATSSSQQLLPPPAGIRLPVPSLFTVLSLFPYRHWDTCLSLPYPSIPATFPIHSGPPGWHLHLVATNCHHPPSFCLCNTPAILCFTIISALYCADHIDKCIFSVSHWMLSTQVQRQQKTRLKHTLVVVGVLELSNPISPPTWKPEQAGEKEVRLL